MARRRDFSPKKIILDRHSSVRLLQISFEIGVQIGTSWWDVEWFHVLILQNLSKRLAELGIPVHDQVTLGLEKAVFRIGQIPGNLLHPRFMWIRRAAREMNAAGLQLHDE